MYALIVGARPNSKRWWVPPFVAARLRKQVARSAEVGGTYACFDTDAAIKSGSIDERTARKY